MSQPSSISFGEPMPAAQAAVQPTTPPTTETQQPVVVFSDLHSIVAQADKIQTDLAIPNPVSASMLATVRVSDSGELGTQINELVVLAKGFNPDQAAQTGFLGRLIGKAKVSKEKLLGEFQTVEKRIDQLVAQIEVAVQRKRESLQTLTAMEQQNMKVYEQRRQQLKQVEQMIAQVDAAIASFGPAGQQDAAANLFAAQNVQDTRRERDRLSKMADGIRKEIFICADVLAPEIRMVEDAAKRLIDMFAEIKGPVINGWRNQFSLYLIQMDQKKDIELATAVYAASNDALRRQADLLGGNVQAIGALDSQSVATIETLEYAHNKLITAFGDLDNLAKQNEQTREQSRVRMEQMQQEMAARLRGQSQQTTASAVATLK